MKTYFLIISLILALLLAACQPAVSPAAVETTPAQLPTATLASATATPAPADPATPLPADTATAAPAPAELPAAAPDSSLVQSVNLPASTLFDVDWDDRSPFESGLTSDQQGLLGQRPGASIYHIDLAIEEDLTTLRGREEVRYTNTEDVPLDSVVFRLFPNLTGGSVEVSNLMVNGQPVEPSYSLQESAMTVSLAQPLTAGEQAVLAMDFVVDVPVDPETSNYGTFASFDNVLALAHFYPMITVYDDEGWNVEVAPPEGDVVYADTSYYLARVTAPEDQVIAASGVTVGLEPSQDAQVMSIAAGPARDFYLVASDEYEVISQQVGETTVNSYAPRAMRRGSEEVARIAAAALRSIEERVGPYAYSEMDVVSTATGALGVEYPGIMAITSRIYDGQYQQFLEGTVAHEVAHQWFYNVIGNDQLDEPWLDEALTQYATLLYFLDQYGQEGYDGFHQSLEGRWARADSEEIPVGLPVAAYSEGGDYPGTYGSIVYGRGPLFFEALAREMGEAVFASFLRDYYDTFAWDVVTAESLRALAEQHCGCDLGQLFSDWVYAN